MTYKYLRVIAAVCLTLLAGSPGQAGTRKGDKLFKQAQAAEVRKDWDVALQLYKQAVDEDPRDSGYLIGMQRRRPPNPPVPADILLSSKFAYRPKEFGHLYECES